MGGGSVLNTLTADVKDIHNFLHNGTLRSVDIIDAYLGHIQKHDG